MKTTLNKLAYIAIGGTLVALGMIISPLNAQKDNFGKIKCTGLEIIDSDTGDALISLGIGERGVFIDFRSRNYRNYEDALSTRILPGSAIFSSPYGHIAIGATDDSDGYFIRIADKTTFNQQVRLGVDANSGFVSLFDNDGKLRTKLTADKLGGGLAVFGNNDRPGILVSSVEGGGGGAVSIHGNEGEVAAILGTSENGGLLSVYRKEGGVAAFLRADRDGGLVCTYGTGDSKGSACIGVNEYGNGTVSTWDKNGYRQ